MKNLYYSVFSSILLASFPFSSFAANDDVFSVSNFTIPDFCVLQNMKNSFKPKIEVGFEAVWKKGEVIERNAILSESMKQKVNGGKFFQGDLALVEDFYKKNSRAGEYQVAAVCFITDMENCGGGKFNNGEYPGSGGGGGIPDDHGTPEELCKEAGYNKNPCPEGSYSDSYCPYDSSYHSECKCEATYNKTCDTSIGEKGVGVACNGKYKECCSACEGYDYTSIPSGYVSNGECQSCDGKKYKIKCNPQQFVLGSNCGTQGGVGNTCTDDGGTYYAECKCPNNYEWSSSQKKCVCATSFKYSCTGTGYAGGDGTACNSKYSKCKCASGFTWNASQGACVCSGFDFCTLSQNCSALGYAKQSCDGKFVKCPFDTSYIYCL